MLKTEWRQGGSTEELCFSVLVNGSPTKLPPRQNQGAVSMAGFVAPIVLVVSFLTVLIIDEYEQIMSLSREVAVELRRRLVYHLIFAWVSFLIGVVMSFLLPGFIPPEVALFISAGVLFFALAGAITAVIESKLKRRGLA